MIARGCSLAGKVRDPLTLYGWLVRNVERLVEELHFHQVRPAALTVHVSYFEADGAGGVVHLDVPSDRFATLLEAAKVGLARAWRRGRVATHLHLVASDLQRQGAWQASLFDPPDPKADAVARVKREVNEAFGRFRLRSGATLYADDFYKDRANEYDVCDIRGKFCF
jgi:DNA polymerase V